MPWEISDSATEPKLEPAVPNKRSLRFSIVIPPNHGKGESRKSRKERQQREELFQQQKGCCYWCGTEMEMSQFRVTSSGRIKHNQYFATFEHLVPRSKGGGRGKNIVLAHGVCNLKRPTKKWPHDPVYGKSKRGAQP